MHSVIASYQTSLFLQALDAVSVLDLLERYLQSDWIMSLDTELQLKCCVACRGLEGPHDCGNYNSPAWETDFFVSSGGSWNTEYGHFFLSWYSNMLLQHADRVLAAATQALNQRGRARRASKLLKVSVNACNCSAVRPVEAQMHPACEASFDH